MRFSSGAKQNFQNRRSAKEFTASEYKAYKHRPYWSLVKLQWILLTSIWKLKNGNVMQGKEYLHYSNTAFKSINYFQSKTKGWALKIDILLLVWVTTWGLFLSSQSFNPVHWELSLVWMLNSFNSLMVT